MGNSVSNPKCFVLFLITAWLIYSGQIIVPNDGFAQTGVSVPKIVNVDKVFSNFMSEWNIPGGSIAIVKDGRLVYARGFGYADKESNELVKPHHLFRIASVSKPITSIAIMKLVEDGLIDVDAKVFGTNGILRGSDYSTILDPRVENITVRHLLHHTSGWGFINGDRDPTFSTIHIARELREDLPIGPVSIIKFMLTTQTLDSEPGTNYFYSNFGFCILGRVIEQVSGKSYENYVKTELLNPLGISEMQLGRNLYENRAPNEVKYYDFPGASLSNSVYGTGERVPRPYGGFNIEAKDSGGGWIASATDLARLLVAVDGFNTKPDILSQPTIQLMTTPSAENNRYGMGWRVNQADNWWHTGSLSGTSSIFVRTSGGLGWAVLFNTRPSNWRDFTLPMANMVWEAIRGIDSWPTHDLFEETTLTENDSLQISEIMVASNKGSLPQWIEFYNHSNSHEVNLKGWTLEIENRRSANFNGLLNAMITFKEKSIKPQGTLLIVSKPGRSSNGSSNAQIYNLNTLHPNLHSMILSEEGFYMKLSNTADKLIDEVGNLDGKRNTEDKPTWQLPTNETEKGARTSMIRRHDDGIPRPGTEEISWISAANTKLATGISTYYGHPNDIGAPGIGSGGALPVQLSKFQAVLTDAGVLLKWTTESELDNAGFYILRGETKSGEFKVVNPTLIQGAGTTSERHTYTWIDTTAKPNIAYYYRIEDISHTRVRKQLATVRMRGILSASGKFTTIWADLKARGELSD